MILIFGGTTEGRLAVDVCDQAGTPFYYSTKSDLQTVEMQNGIRLRGAMTAEDISTFCAEHEIKCIIDAAHPFAMNLHQAIQMQNIPVIRLQRQFEPHQEGVIYCQSYEDAIQKMESYDLKCLLALSGTNTISKLAPYWSKHHTLFRILNRPDSLEIAKNNNFPQSHLIYYPEDHSLPSKEEERKLMQEVGCDAILTKESGESGGFKNKVNAALELGLKVFVVEHPSLPDHWIYATGKYGLRRSIEHLVPDFFKLKTGFTTGACATAAVKAALISLLYQDTPEEVHFALPDGEVMTMPVQVEDVGVASTVKDFSDDPDVTKGCKITARLTPGTQGIRFLHGEGVGVVTLPGLGIPVGEPAINPTPRKMITDEIRALTTADFDITISVEDGAEIVLGPLAPPAGADAVAVQVLGYLGQGVPFLEFAVDAPHDLQLVGDRMKDAVLQSVAEGRVESHGAVLAGTVPEGLRLLLHADLGPLANLLRLELGDVLYHGDDEPAHGGGGVQVLGGRTELLLPLGQFIHHEDEVAGVPMDTVHLEHEDEIPLVYLGHHLGVAGTAGGPSGVSLVAVDLVDR